MSVNKLAKTAKIISSGDVQLIPIPREYWIDCDEVVFNKFGHMLTVTPVDKVDEVRREAANLVSDDFMKDEYPDEYFQKRM